MTNTQTSSKKSNSPKNLTSFYMRIIHRYLGFFLAGIMAVYAFSGIILIFRDTNFLKREQRIEKQLPPNTQSVELGGLLKIKSLKITQTKNGRVYFKEGVYDTQTGLATYTINDLPFVFRKMTHLHKASSKDPLYWLNIFFGLSLFFFVISSFWMFLPKTKMFRKGMYFTVAGIVFSLILIFI